MHDVTFGNVLEHKSGTGEAGWVQPLGENSMDMSGCEKPLFGAGWAVSLLNGKGKPFSYVVLSRSRTISRVNIA